MFAMRVFTPRKLLSKHLGEAISRDEAEVLKTILEGMITKIHPIHADGVGDGVSVISNDWCIMLDYKQILPSNTLVCLHQAQIHTGFHHCTEIGQIFRITQKPQKLGMKKIQNIS